MAKTPRALSFTIDKLTRSIENAVTGDRHPKLILPLTPADIKRLKKKDWLFDWKREAADSTRSVYKLVIVGNEDVVQGLISLEDKGDHIAMELIESAMFNRGKRKMYLGVLGNLVAFACKQSFERGYSGYVAFLAKTALIEHYKKELGAKMLFGASMVLETAAAALLVARYFPHNPDL